MTTSNDLNFTVEPRKTGKHHSRTLRSEKKVPAVIYGSKFENENFWLLEKELVKYMGHKFDNSIFTLKSGESKLNDIKVLKKAVDVHPVSRRPVHVDFYAIDMKAKIRVDVEISFTGKAEGVREGGLLSVVRRTVEVECLPTDIPESIEIDVTPLNVGDNLHVSDLKAPANVEIMTAPERTLCSVAMVEEEAEAPVAAAAEGAEGAATPDAAAAAGAEAEKKEGGEEKKD